MPPMFPLYAAALFLLSFSSYTSSCGASSYLLDCVGFVFFRQEGQRTHSAVDPRISKVNRQRIVQGSLAPTAENGEDTVVPGAEVIQ